MATDDSLIKAEVQQIIDQAIPFPMTDSWRFIPGETSIDKLSAQMATTMAQVMHALLKPDCDWSGREFEEAAQKTMNAVLDFYKPEGRRNGLAFLRAVSILHRGWVHGVKFREWHSRVYSP